MIRSISSVLSKIHSIEDYAAITHEIPYTYQLQKEQGSVTVVGVNHVHEREHPAFALLDTIFAEVPLDMVLVEGMDNDFNEPLARKLLTQLTLKEAALRGGEAIYSAVQALQHGVLWQPAEPADDILFSYLYSLGFSKPDIISWYVLRLLPQYIASGEMVAFFEYLEPFMTELRRATKWDEITEGGEAILAHARMVLGHELSLHNFAQAFSYTDPRAVVHRDNDFTVFNTLSATADVLRDRTMVTHALTKFTERKRVLLVCGVAHAVMQEPAYRAFLA